MKSGFDDILMLVMTMVNFGPYVIMGDPAIFGVFMMWIQIMVCFDVVWMN